MRRFGFDDPKIILLLFILREEEDMYLPDDFKKIKDNARQF